MTTSEDSHPDPALRWFHRRRLAYLAFVSSLAVILLLTFLSSFGIMDPSFLNALAPFLTTFLLGCFSIVGAYVGLSTLDDIKTNSGRD